MPILRIAVALSGLVLSSAVCNPPQCPSPPLNITALAPCMGQTIPPSCCPQIKPLATNACIRVWLKNPQIAPFQAQILKAGQACKITSLPECLPQVKSLCSTECNSVPAGLGGNSSNTGGSSTNAPTASSSSNAPTGAPSQQAVVAPPLPPCNATQCELPTLNITAFTSCMGNMSQNCCVQARALAMNPCIRVWIQAPQLIAFQAHIMSAGQQCNITNLADCTQQVRRQCSLHCATVPNATNGTAINNGNNNQTCPNQFEEWTSCRSSSCWESKCVDGKLQKTGPMCTADCRTGCRCKDGYTRVLQTKASNNMNQSANFTCIPEVQCGLNNSQPMPAGECPMFRCMMFCANGFMKDANGCNLCQCQQATTTTTTTTTFGKAGKAPKGKKAAKGPKGRR